MQSRRRLLLVTSTPDDQDFIDANTELDLISEIFRDGNNRKKFEIDIKHNIMKGSFQYKLDDFNPHIVHFSGHGTKKGKLVFQDGEEIDPTTLKNIFNNVKSIELIFLSACYSIKQVDELKKISNIKNIIGMNDKIAPYIANVFATHFYKNYTKRENVHIAFANAMNNFKQIYKSILDPETLKPHDPDTLIQLIKTDKKHVDGNSSSSKEIEEDNTKYLQFDFVQKDPIPNDLFYQMQRCVSKYEEEVSIKKIDPVLFWNSDSSNISKIIPMLLTYSNEYGLDQNQVNIMKNNVEKIQVLVKLAVDNNDDNIVNVEDESSVNNNNNDDDEKQNQIHKELDGYYSEIINQVFKKLIYNIKIDSIQKIDPLCPTDFGISVFEDILFDIYYFINLTNTLKEIITQVILLDDKRKLSHSLQQMFHNIISQMKEKYKIISNNHIKRTLNCFNPKITLLDLEELLENLESQLVTEKLTRIMLFESLDNVVLINERISGTFTEVVSLIEQEKREMCLQ